MRVHLLDPATGHYVASLDDPGLWLDAERQAALLAHPGRPSQFTANNNSDPNAQILKAIPPVQTHPYDLLSRPEVRGPGGR